MVSPGWFQPTHMPPPDTAISTPYPLKSPPPSFNHGKSRRLHHPWFDLVSVSEPAATTLTEPKWRLTGGVPPSHTHDRLLLNMEHPQRQYPTRVAQHTRGKIYGEDHIYGDTVFTVRLVSEPPWIENESPLVLSRTKWCDDLGNFTTNFYFNIILIR